MKYEDVLALAKAGFSSAQIAQFAEEERQTAQAVSEVKAPEIPEVEEASAVQTAPPPIAPPAPKTDPTDEILKGITQELASLKASIQTRNIQATNQPARESVESILASIISPTYTHKEE